MNTNWTRHRVWLTCICLLVAFATAASIRAQRGESPDTTLQRAIQQELVEGHLEAAVDLYKKVIDNRASSERVKAQAWLNLGRCYERLADANARSAYERVIGEFKSQAAIASEAQARISALESRESQSRLFTDLTYLTDLANTYAPNAPPGGAVSPNGRYVFGSSDPEGSVFDTITHEKGSLASEPSRAAALPHAVFSADSRQIVFAVAGGIRTSTPTTAEMRITALPLVIRESRLEPGRTVFRRDDVIGIAPFGWNRDGRHVLALLSRRDGNNEIATIDLTDGSSRLVKSLGARVPRRLAMSPDGRHVAFDAPISVSPAGENRDIFLLSVETGAEMPLSEDPARDEAPLWTPDGTAVVFFSERGGKPGMWLREVTAGTPTGATRIIQQYDAAVWPVGFATNGTLYYVSEKDQPRPGGSIWIDPRFLPNYQGLQLFLSDVDGGGMRVRGPAIAVTNSLVSFPLAPRWLPAPGTLAFIRRPLNENGRGVVVRSLSSGSDRMFERRSTYGAWFHSGTAQIQVRTVLPANGTDQRALIERLDLESGTASEIVNLTTPRGPINTALSADDRTLYVCNVNGPEGLIRVFDVNSRQEIRRFSFRTEARGRAFSVENMWLSPDGRTLAMWTDAGLFRVGADGAGFRELYAADPFDWGSRPVWTKDGKFILIAVSDEKRRWRLMRVPADGGAAIFTGLTDTLPKDVGMEFDLSPDGTKLAFIGVAPTISASPQ